MPIKVEIWLLDEVTTRNCTNCIPNANDEYVNCDKGHPLLDSQGEPYSYDHVINASYLLWPCQGCPDFERQFCERR